MSCSNVYKVSDDGNGDVPTAKGTPATVGNAEFEGTLNNISLTGDGWTEDQVKALITPFTLEILDNKIYAGTTMRGEQLLCPDSSNPNVVEANGKSELEGGGYWQEYIKMTLDNANSPTKATITFHFKMYEPAYAAHPTMSDTVLAIYEGDFTKKAGS